MMWADSENEERERELGEGGPVRDVLYGYVKREREGGGRARERERERGREKRGIDRYVDR